MTAGYVKRTSIDIKLVTVGNGCSGRRGVVKTPIKQMEGLTVFTAISLLHF